MTRTEVRRRQRRARKLRRLKQAGALTVLCTIEALIAAVPTAVAAAIILPMAYAQRGYGAVGGECLLLLLIFCAAYSFAHNRICDWIFGEVKSR